MTALFAYHKDFVTEGSSDYQVVAKLGIEVVAVEITIS